MDIVSSSLTAALDSGEDKGEGMSCACSVGSAIAGTVWESDVMVEEQGCRLKIVQIVVYGVVSRSGESESEFDLVVVVSFRK